MPATRNAQKPIGEPGQAEPWRRAGADRSTSPDEADR